MAEIRWELFDAWTPELAWWYGCLLGDGNVFESRDNAKVSLAGSVSTTTRWLALVCPTKQVLDIKRKGPAVNAKVASIDSKALVAYIKKRWGICGPKSGHLPWPEGMPLELFPHFARGLWDTDGSLFVESRKKHGEYNDAPRASYTSKDGAFATRLHHVLGAVVGISDVAIGRETKGKFYWYRFKLSGESAMKVADYLYKDAPAHLVNDDRLEAYGRMQACYAQRSTALTCACGKPARRMAMCLECWSEQRHLDGEARTGLGTKCRTEGCLEEVYTNGLCGACYHRWRRQERAKARGLPLPVPRRRRAKRPPAPVG